MIAPVTAANTTRLRSVGMHSAAALRRENLALRDTIAALEIRVESERDAAAAGRESLALMREVNQHLVLEKLDAVDERRADETGVQRQTVFLSILAHELRNPLSSIATANSMMHNLVALEPRIEKLSDIVGRQVMHLVRLVDDLLDVGRISNGKLSICKSEITLSDIVEGMLDTVQPLLEQRHQTIVLNLPQAPVKFDGDRVRLAQLLSNLVINAGKFSAPGQSVYLSARASADGLSIMVTDEGKGVPAEQQPYIFDLFSQGGQQGEHALAGGLGIGLSLVRTIAEMHGGSVRMSSAGSGCGSKFTVLLPLPVVKQVI